MIYCAEIFRKANTTLNGDFYCYCSSMRILGSRYPRNFFLFGIYRGAGKSLARPGRKQATATEDFDVHISYL